MHLETDYLVIGCGAVGMAFVDTLLTETDAQILIVDRYAKPGGHWNFAYPFVTLHQPSQYYGVSSKELSRGRIEEKGLNKGLYEMASGGEINVYFEEVMQQTFLPSGRVQYFPMCEYKGNYEFESLLTQQKYTVDVHRKVVDCTILKTAIPATHTPNFTKDEEVQFIPLNDLPRIQQAPAGFIVIGGGKTGVDACLWLLENHVTPDAITWIVSRDAWWLNRENLQPTMQFFEKTMGTQAAQTEAIAQAESIPTLFDRLEEVGVFLRIDSTIRPQMFHGATISEREVEELRKIKHIVRMGRVKHIAKDQIHLDQGVIPTSVRHVHVDCSASAVTNLETKPIFQGNTITPQTVRAFQPLFSAAFVAYVEANYEGDEKKNELCNVVQLPNHDTDWIPMMAAQMTNQFTWSQDKELRRWVRENRLDGYGKMVRNVDREDIEKMAILRKMRDHALPALLKLQQFSQELESSNSPNMKNPQLQVKRKMFFQNRLVDMPESEMEIEAGEVLVKIEKFAYTSNNITYAAAGDLLGYWKFFPPMGQETGGWGVIPVWGFAEVTNSKVAEISEGERLFGYFPPASQVKMRPTAIAPGRFVEASPHRTQLPAGYNLYRRVDQDPTYNPDLDREQMLLWPLYVTAFCINDALIDKDWYGAKQVVIMSASSKTSIGTAYAIQGTEGSPTVIGVTSPRNLEVVQGLGIYDHSLTYDQVSDIDPQIPTVIVDMAGNAKVLAALHTHLGDQMKFTYNVGITHWADSRPQEGVIQERSKMFFAPGHIQKRMKEWGPKEFNQKSTQFLMGAAAKTQKWLEFRTVKGLEELASLHPAVCEGKIPANQGLIVEM